MPVFDVFRCRAVDLRISCCKKLLFLFRLQRRSWARRSRQDKILNKGPILRHIATFPYRAVRGSQIVLNYVQPRPLDQWIKRLKWTTGQRVPRPPHITRMIIASTDLHFHKSWRGICSWAEKMLQPLENKTNAAALEKEMPR